ncbi:MAG: type II toxin-antitoxin system Phd/YefM family antitoxin [Hyphomicrobiaceae bacterium]
MPTYTVHQAKTNLSKLLAEAEAGEEVVIARDDKPVVRLTPITAKKPKRKFGAYKGQATITDAFFEPMGDAELRDWHEGPIFPHDTAATAKTPAKRRRKP